MVRLNDTTLTSLGVIEEKTDKFIVAQLANQGNKEMIY